MPTHATILDNVRVEVAFSDDPNTTTPAFTDLTSRAHLDAGIEISRGRSEDVGDVQVGQCSLTLNNTDGLLTPGRSVTRTNMVPNPSFEVNTTGWLVSQVAESLSSAWAASGAQSVRLAPSGASDDSYMILDGDVGAMRAGMVAGNTYTISGTVNTPVALTGTLSARARAIVVHHRIGAASYTILTSTAGPTTGAARVSLTFTLPVGTTEAFIRFYNGATNSAANWVYWDAIMLEQAGTLGTYIEGTVSTSSGGDVKPQNRLRVTYRDQAVNGNLLSAQNASFETSGNVGDWIAGGSVPPTLSNSTTHPQAGTRGMLITWGTGGSFPQAQLNDIPQVIGRTYTASAYVWVPRVTPPSPSWCPRRGVGPRPR